MRFLVFFSLLIFGVSHSQDSIILEKKLNESIQFLDEAMQDNNSNIVEVLDQNVTFGHSNGWIQNYDDFIKDIKSNKVKYQSVNPVNHDIGLVPSPGTNFLFLRLSMSLYMYTIQ